MDCIHKNIEEHNPNKKQKILIVFDDIIADMLSNKKLNPIITELFIKGKKLNISLVFITQSYFTLPNFYIYIYIYIYMKYQNYNQTINIQQNKIIN